MVEKAKTDAHTDNRPTPSVLSGRVSHSSSGDKRVLWSSKSLTAWIWQHDKWIDDNEIILNCVRKLIKKLIRKEARKGPSFKKVTKKMKCFEFCSFSGGSIGYCEIGEQYKLLLNKQLSFVTTLHVFHQNVMSNYSMLLTICLKLSRNSSTSKLIHLTYFSFYSLLSN